MGRVTIRPSRSAAATLLATLLAATLLAGLALAGCGSRGTPRTSATLAAQPTPTSIGSTRTTTPVPGVTTGPQTGAAPQAGGATRLPGGTAAAVAAARAFLVHQVGMGELVAGPLHRTGPNTAEVWFRPKLGEDGRPLPATGPTTVVELQRGSTGWSVLGTRSRSIRLASPAAGAWIASPVTISGRASAFEGTVQVAVKEVRKDQSRVLGSGFVTGSGTAELGPFSGRIAFHDASSASGWLVLFTDSAADGGIQEATAVPVHFAAPAPRIQSVRTTPGLNARSAFALELPPGAGEVVVRVKAVHASRVLLLLTPTGTQVADLTRLLDEDGSAGDGWTVTWRYEDQPLLGYLTVRAIGPGGTAERQIGVHHPDRA